MSKASEGTRRLSLIMGVVAAMVYLFVLFAAVADHGGGYVEYVTSVSGIPPSTQWILFALLVQLATLAVFFFVFWGIGRIVGWLIEGFRR